MALLNRTTQLRMRRILRRKQKQMEAVTEAAEQQFDANLIARFDRLMHVKRFTAGWLTLVILAIVCTTMQTLSLSGYFQTVQPVSGGIYNEGIVGTYSNANPVFATGSVDLAVSHLIFAGLLRYNDQNQLVGNLASDYSVDSTGKHYIFHLRPGLTWQDDAPLTSQDVAYTFHLIQNPDTQSPLLAAWQNITISAPDTRTVLFDLPNAFSAFPYNLTTGIIPEHLLASTPPAQLRAASFNTTTPIGAGPFAWQALQTKPTNDPAKALSLIALKPFKNYAGGAPMLNGFVMHVFGDNQGMIQAFKHREINAMAGLTSVPASVASANDTTVQSFPSTAAMMTFFKTSTGVLSDVQVRQALVAGVDTDALLRQLGYASKAVSEPLLRGQLGYDPKYAQASYSPAHANQILDADGWARNSKGLRHKNGEALSFGIYAEDSAENRATLRTLVRDWAHLGVQVNPILQNRTDFQTTLEFHTYDALLHAISIGVDPDVFAYWDSSQADIRSNARLNFSEYKSTTADSALEAGRTRLDPALRVVKYRPFLQAWQTDAPALGLYQPRFLYITRGTVYGLSDHMLNSDSDRYASVADWEIHTSKVTNK
ncbi:MAG TPA: peptide ABC transporter substrate-binding protein [Candidatus Saccharimonadales bacterium]|nr:peptide ABC transporter substrate-binding protein [Candidatus Saccharimonadales bacterium]